MRAYIALFRLVALIPAVFSANGAIQFFPQWSNIDAASPVQIMDLYIDHGFNAPNQNANFLQNMTLVSNLSSFVNFLILNSVLLKEMISLLALSLSN